MNCMVLLVSLVVADQNAASEWLDWVNPVRCVQHCAMPPKVAPVAVNAVAVPLAHGRFKIAPEAVVPTQNLIAGGKKAGYALSLRDAIRPYGNQAFIFRKYKEAGRAARPGHSEHELEGLAIDLVMPSLAAIAWLAEHAHEHGFAVSYPPGKQRVTGYRAEPWHVRYVGIALATELHRRGITLEEWLRENPERGISGDCGKCPLPESQPLPCGNVTVPGSCRGGVLTWCYDGALTRVDCTVSGERCGKDEVSGNFTCLSR